MDKQKEDTMNRNKIVAILIMFAVLLPASTYAQGKVEGNTLRLKGGMFLGSLRTDLEKRGFYSDLGRLDYNREWENASRFTLFNGLGADYYHQLSAGMLQNFFLGFHINRFGRSYEWNSFYPVGFGMKEADYGFAYSDINLGVTISPAANFRILPKYVIRSMAQNLEGKNLGLGLPILVGRDTTSSYGTSGLIGVGLEFDISNNVTLYSDILFYGPFLFNTSGEYKSEKITLDSGPGINFILTEGGYRFSSEKLSLGGSFLVAPKLRLFASVENEKMTAKAVSPFSFSASGNGLNTFGTLMEYVSATSDHSINIFGFKFGATYDINL
ncbi:hypothetical protein P3G55_05390 [Leptospira sp. 96542]|nr:hypothetical protein [Leptospira sp. 96542]